MHIHEHCPDQNVPEALGYVEGPQSWVAPTDGPQAGSVLRLTDLPL